MLAAVVAVVLSSALSPGRLVLEPHGAGAELLPRDGLLLAEEADEQRALEPAPPRMRVRGPVFMGAGLAALTLGVLSFALGGEDCSQKDGDAGGWCREFNSLDRILSGGFVLAGLILETVGINLFIDDWSASHP